MGQGVYFLLTSALSCEEQNWISAEANPNRQGFAFEKSVRLNVANESPADRRVQVRYALRDSLARVIEEWSEDLFVPAYSAVWLEKREFPDVRPREEYMSYALWEEGVCISEGTVLFAPPKYFSFRDPKLSCRVEGGEIIVYAQSFAKNVEILNREEDLLLSDNYFDMNAGEKRIRVLRRGLCGAQEGTAKMPEPEELRLRSVYDIGR